MEAQKSRKSYDTEFKQVAVILVTKGGKRATKVAKGLGINENLIYRWIKLHSKHPSNPFPGKG